ncbi:MAG: DMT family transporter [Proteobacteria bacterium]|nr:DMT family transporter [Pseudomonadota bacterium]
MHRPGQLNVRRGYLIFIAALAFLPLMDAIAKLLSTRLPVIEIVWARHIVYALAVVPLALLRDGWQGLRTRHPGWQLARGLCMCLASGCFFMAVSRMPVADAMAIFLCYPAILLPITALVLGERPTARQWSMVACGFVGALIVVRPTFHGLADGAVFALGSAVLYPLSMIATRRLDDESSPLVTTALSALIGAIGYSVVVPAVFTVPSATDLWLLVAIGLIAAIGHYGIVAAHRHALSSQLAPLGYTEIVGAVIAGALMFGVVPTPATWFGIALIVGSGIVATWPSRTAY